MQTVYLDHAASTPVHPRVEEAMQACCREKYGNPSSLHRSGREAREAIERAREQVAGALGARAEEIVFTGGGTEADNHAVKGVAFHYGESRNHIITDAIEHHAVLEPCRYLERRGFEVTYLPVDGRGLLDPDEVRRALTPRTCLISVMHANNEVGTIQPLEEISRIAGEAGVHLHVDAIQTMGILEVDVGRLGVDLLAISAHKLYGPKGIGCLYVRRGTGLDNLIHGGLQEGKRRAGTENVVGIVGFGVAMELAASERQARVAHLTPLRDRLIAGIAERIPASSLNGHPTLRLPGNASVRFACVDGETVCLDLDSAGIAAATGSACSSDSLEPSHVLTAMGLGAEEARGSVRLTLGMDNSEEDVEYVLDQLAAIVERLRCRKP